MLTGLDLTDAAARMRDKQREIVTQTEKVELDRSEINAMRRDIASALETIAMEFQGELHSELAKLKSEFGTVLAKLNEAAEAELRRNK